jgi:plasmid stabilization system protein ParE
LAEVRLSVDAVKELDRMIVTHSLPPDTRERVRRSLRVLEQFPRIGRQLEGRWRPLRFILGPWRWMLIIYSYEEPQDPVFVVAFQDARSSAAATAT